MNANRLESLTDVEGLICKGKASQVTVHPTVNLLIIVIDSRSFILTWCRIIRVIIKVDGEMVQIRSVGSDVSVNCILLPNATNSNLFREY